MNKEKLTRAGFQPATFGLTEVAGWNPALVNFSLFIQNLSQIRTQSVSLVVHYIIFFKQKKNIQSFKQNRSGLSEEIHAFKYHVGPVY